MCETCFELAWRPLMTTSIVTLPCSTTRVAEPEAVVSIPVSLKLSPLGEGDGLGLATMGLGEGEVAAVPPPEAPQAEMVAANATSATTRFKPAVSLQLCSWRYHCRLLDGHSRSASLTSGVSGNELVKARPRPPTPRQGCREEERIPLGSPPKAGGSDEATGPLTQASAPAGRSAEMGR